MTKIVQIKQTRIQREKRLLIQKAALQVFSEFGLRGATLDKIAKACGLTKPNILYYYSCLLYTSPSPRDYAASRMPSSA